MLNVDLITVMYTSTLAKKKIQTKTPKQKPQITKQNIIINKSIEKKHKQIVSFGHFLHL